MALVHMECTRSLQMQEFTHNDETKDIETPKRPHKDIFEHRL